MTHAWDTLITGAAFVMKVNKPKGISAGNEGNLRGYTCIYERLLWWPCWRWTGGMIDLRRRGGGDRKRLGAGKGLRRSFQGSM